MEATASLPPYISTKELVEQDPAPDPLFRVSSFPSGSPDQQWRRRGGRRTSSLLARQRSFGREVGHAAAETYLITWLSFKLLRYLGYSIPKFTVLFLDNDSVQVLSLLGFRCNVAGMSSCIFRK